MTQHQMNCILTLAKTLNFREASELINITQSTLTYQIKRVEDELGLRIFDRDKKSVSVTAAGEKIIAELEPIYNSLLSLKLTANDIVNNKINSVSIAHYDSANDPILLPMMKMLSEKYPEVEQSIIFGNYYIMNTLLDSGKADIIFTNLSLLKDNEKYKAIPLEKGPVYAYLNKNHPLAGKKLLTIDDVQGETFLIHSTNPEDLFCWHARYFAEHPESFGLKIYQTREERLFRANLGEGIMLSGYKIVNIPEQAVVIPFVDGDDTTSCIACLKKNYRRLKSIMEFIADVYASRPE